MEFKKTLNKNPADFTRTFRNPPKKGGGCGGIVLFCEIGDLEPPGRPIDMNDTHSLQWHMRGSAPPLLTPYPHIFWLVLGKAPARNTSPSDRPTGCAK